MGAGFAVQSVRDARFVNWYLRYQLIAVLDDGLVRYADNRRDSPRAHALSAQHFDYLLSLLSTA